MGGWEYRKEDEVDLNDGYPKPNPSDWAGPFNETEGIKGESDYPYIVPDPYRNRSWTHNGLDRDENNGG